MSRQQLQIMPVITENDVLALDPDGGRCDPILIAPNDPFDWDAYADQYAPEDGEGVLAEWSDHHFW